MVIESLLEEVRASHRKVNSAIYKRPDIPLSIRKKRRPSQSLRRMTNRHPANPTCERSNNVTSLRNDFEKIVKLFLSTGTRM